MEQYKVFTLPSFKGKRKTYNEKDKDNFILMCKYLSPKFHFYDIESENIACNHINLYDKKQLYYVEKINIQSLINENLLCRKCLNLKNNDGNF